MRTGAVIISHCTDALKSRASGALNRARHLCLQSRLKNKNFTIISNNCWGGIVYQRLGLAYTTPFVGLFVFAPDYIRILSNLNVYLELPLEFITQSRYEAQLRESNSAGTYPIALLGDAEIHFQHYASKGEVVEKWNRRVARIHWDNLFLKFCDRDLCTYDHLRAFDSLDFEHKVCFAARPYPDVKSCVVLEVDSGKPCVVSEMTHYQDYFDVIGWLNS